MRLKRHLCSAAAVGLAVVLWLPQSARGAESPPARLTIAFTGDVSGYLEPCG